MLNLLFHTPAFGRSVQVPYSRRGLNLGHRRGADALSPFALQAKEAEYRKRIQEALPNVEEIDSHAVYR